MKRVLHVTMSNAYGGAETVIFSITDNLNNKYDFRYLCPSGKIEELLINKNLNFNTLNSKRLKEIRNQIKQINPDIIHAHDFTASVLCSLVSGKIPVISHLHTSHNWIKRPSIKLVIYYLASFRFKDIVVVSKSMAEEMYLYSTLKKKVKILVNPIDTERINNLANEYEVNEKYDIAFLGRLSDYKNPIKFINIIEDLKKRGIGTKAIIIGDGELKESCIQEINKLNLSDNIAMKGFIKNPFPLIKNSKIVVIPSKVEAFGLSAMESIILGKPVIASDIGGLRDFISKDNGRLCQLVEDFSKEIEVLFENEDLYNNLSNKCVQSLDNMANIEVYIEEIEKIYNS